jgi:catechol 2,3-dioxygenase-like lactoylglutathione lyase family enzyme
MSNVFRFIFWPGSYEQTVSFYRDRLEQPIVMQWDRSPQERGTVFKLGAGEIEILANAPGKKTIDPQGFEIAIEVEDVDSFYKFIKEKGISFRGEIANKPWGHRAFSINDPDGIKLIFFSVI